MRRPPDPGGVAGHARSLSSRTPRFAPEILRRRLDPDLPGPEARLTA
jgi:hypothetical protein